MPGETWEEAAKREVREETGLDTRVIRFAASVGYQPEGVPKVVLFWVMAHEGTDSFRPTPEVDRLVWLPPSRAFAKLSHVGEQQSVRKQFLGQKRRLFPLWRLRARLGWLSLEWSAYQRLVRAFRESHVEVANLLARSESKEGPWAESAREILREAEEAITEYEVDAGWRYLKAARRMELFGLEAVDHAVLLARAETIANEAEEKLDSWREESVRTLLLEGKELKTDLDASLVAEAAKILDDHFDNVWYKMRTVQRQLTVLAASRSSAQRCGFPSPLAYLIRP